MERKRRFYFDYHQPGVRSKVPRSTLFNRRSHLEGSTLRKATIQNNVDAHAPPNVPNNINVAYDDDMPHNYGGDVDSFDDLMLDDIVVQNHESEEINNENDYLEDDDPRYDIDGICIDDLYEGMNEDNNENINDYTADDYVPHVEEGENDMHVDPNYVYNREIRSTVNIQLRDLMLIIYAYAIRHNLNWKATENAAQMIKHILQDDTIPTSKYHFKKLFCASTDTVPIVHMNCKSCKRYLGTEEDLKKNDAPTVCDICNEAINLKTKHSDGSFFITIPIAPQLKRNIEKSLASGELVFKDNIDVARNKISDIFEGQLYRDLITKCRGRKFVTLTINTDGAQVFKSTAKASLYPLQFFINEICLTNRFKRSNIILSSVSFGGTPDMSSFVKPFIEEINLINNNDGLKVNIGGIEERVFVIPLIFTLDSVAKCDILQKVQFNGYKGCPYCHHKGTLIPPANIRYCQSHAGSLRTNSNTRNAMMEAYTSGKRVRGYKGISVLYALPYLDIVWQVVIDKMHNMDLGVVKKLFYLWLSSSQNGKE